MSRAQSINYSREIAGNLSPSRIVSRFAATTGATGNTIQCTESVCGDPDGLTAIGPKIYTCVIRPRMIGLRVGTKF